jgi:hypothetical protein
MNMMSPETYRLLHLLTNIRNCCLLLQSCRICNFPFSSNFAPLTSPNYVVSGANAPFSSPLLRTRWRPAEKQGCPTTVPALSTPNLCPKVAFTRCPSRSGAPGGVTANLFYIKFSQHNNKRLKVLFIATCFDSTESSSRYDWNDMCSQDTHAHFGIPKGLLICFRKGYLLIYNCNKLRGLNPRANYTDRAAAAGRRS